MSKKKKVTARGSGPRRKRPAATPRKKGDRHVFKNIARYSGPFNAFYYASQALKTLYRNLWYVNQLRPGTPRVLVTGVTAEDFAARKGYGPPSFAKIETAYGADTPRGRLAEMTFTYHRDAFKPVLLPPLGPRPVWHYVKYTEKAMTLYAIKDGDKWIAQDGLVFGFHDSPRYATRFASVDEVQKAIAQRALVTGSQKKFEIVAYVENCSCDLCKPLSGGQYQYHKAVATPAFLFVGGPLDGKRLAVPDEAETYYVGLREPFRMAASPEPSPDFTFGRGVYRRMQLVAAPPSSAGPLTHVVYTYAGAEQRLLRVGDMIVVGDDAYRATEAKFGTVKADRAAFMQSGAKQLTVAQNRLVWAHDIMGWRVEAGATIEILERRTT